MTHDLADTARAWHAAGRAGVVVEVVHTRGSAPREAGTRMLVAADAVAGSIGGGHLEWVALGLARDALAGRAALPAAEQVYALGPALGQCCGGSVTLRWQWLADTLASPWPAPAPRFVLQLHGAGHVGRAIAALLAHLPCRVSWIDERDDAFPTTPLPPHVTRVAVDVPEAEVALAPPGSLYLVLTHSHELDLRIVDAVLRRGDGGFLGLIGSSSKRARFVHRLRERGHAEAALARLVCPIGVDGIAGKEPEVIALAAVAQLLQQAPQEQAGRPQDRAAPGPPAAAIDKDRGATGSPESP